jgi:hypothetical protein
MGVPYEELRKENNPITKIKEYYRKQLQDGQELWWIDTHVEERAVSPIIKPYRMLDGNEQERFITESMILFPEIFGRTQLKYERSAAYLITEYNTVSASLRDKFTAGGKVGVSVNGVDALVPQIFSNLMKKAKDISSLIEKLSEEKLKYYWRTENLQSPRAEQWKQMIDYHTGTQLDNVSASDIYEWGLRNA